jgi:oligogalacturonide lyase
VGRSRSPATTIFCVFKNLPATLRADLGGDTFCNHAAGPRVTPLLLLLMKTILLVVILSCAALPAFANSTPVEKPSVKSTEKSSLKGKIYPDEHKTFIAPESGLEVIQLTTDPAEDAHLYFTSDGFVPDDHGLVFTSKRSGNWNLFYINLETFRFVQLTDSKKISGTDAVVSPATKEVYYRDGNTIKAVHLKTLVEHSIDTVPAGYDVSTLSITASGKALAYSIQENIPIASKTAKIYSDMTERFQKRPWCAVVTGRTDGIGWHEVVRQKKWFSHTLINPLNENLILYCHEGPWDEVEQRMWLVDSAGRDNHPLRREEKSKVKIGHEFWFHDGIHVGYQVQEPGGVKSIGVADVLDGLYLEYPTPYNDSHMQANSKGTTFVGDGSDKEPFINLYHLDSGKLTGTHLWKHESSFSQQHWHPHPRFSPDDRSIVFTSSRDGNGNVYLIKLNVDKR